MEGLPGPHHGAYLARGSLHNLHEALWYYDKTNGHLPLATNAQSGERLSCASKPIGPSFDWGFITASTKHDKASVAYDPKKAWNDPANRQLQECGAWLFSYTQTDGDLQRRKGKAGEYATYYKAITGPGTAFDSTKVSSLKELPKSLILIVRVEKSDTHWMEPGDLSIANLRLTKKRNGCCWARTVMSCYSPMARGGCCPAKRRFLTCVSSSRSLVRSNLTETRFLGHIVFFRKPQPIQRHHRKSAVIEQEPSQ